MHSGRAESDLLARAPPLPESPFWPLPLCLLAPISHIDTDTLSHAPTFSSSLSFPSQKAR